MTTQSRPRETADQRGSAILGSNSGETFLLSGNVESPASKEEDSGGSIFTATSMPELEEILNKLEIVTAVIEKPLPAIPKEDRQKAPAHRDATIGFGSMLVLGGLPVGTVAAGITMMVAVLAGSSASNPYLALFLIVGGLGLGLTAWSALQDRRSDS